MKTTGFPSLIAALALTTACSDGAPRGPTSAATVFEGARILTGTGDAPIESGILVVEDGRITQVGPSGEFAALEGAARVDLTGKTVMPALVNAHIHLSSDPEERAAQLRQMAYYGAGTVISLGLDAPGTPSMVDDPVPGGARALTAGQGITAPEPGRSEVPFWVTSEDEARAAVDSLAAQDVDFVKIWVDDRGGQYDRLSPDLYGAVMDAAHGHGLKVTAHVFRLEDAKGLLRAGIDAFAHGIRDRDVDDELVTLWQEEHSAVVLVPNLPDPGVVRDLGWLADMVPAEQLAEMQAAATDRPDAQEFFGIQARNLDRLSEAGIPIAFGTDGSQPWQVHLEMEDMVRAGMTPAEVIVAATRTSAELLGVADVGVLAPGRSADFVVLDANPLDDITNTRLIDAVYLRGAAVDREGMRTATGDGDGAGG